MQTFQLAGATINIYQDKEKLAEKLAEYFVELAEKSIQDHGKFTVALSGGSTPKALYSLLATDEYAQKISWDKVYMFWGDERCVSHESKDSNYRMVNEALISKVPIPKENVFATQGQDRNPEESAKQYEQTIKDFFANHSRKYPVFDLVLLGLGPEGHTASMFPGSLALTEPEKIFMAVYVEKLSANRLTLTLKAINAAKNICFIVAGEDKAEILSAILTKTSANDKDKLPAACIHPNAGHLNWFIDRQASLKLGLDILHTTIEA